MITRKFQSRTAESLINISSTSDTLAEKPIREIHEISGLSRVKKRYYISDRAATEMNTYYSMLSDIGWDVSWDDFDDCDVIRVTPRVRTRPDSFELLLSPPPPRARRKVRRENAFATYCVLRELRVNFFRAFVRSGRANELKLPTTLDLATRNSDFSNIFVSHVA